VGRTPGSGDGVVLAGRPPGPAGFPEEANDLLEEAIDHLALSHRVVVICDRAEAAGRDPLLRGRFDAVVARAFGPPAVTAECGSPFCGPGCLVVSEPPVEVAWRWPVRELDCLGLTDGVGPVLGLWLSTVDPGRDLPQPVSAADRCTVKASVVPRETSLNA
jgi:hypothetical protein